MFITKAIGNDDTGSWWTHARRAFMRKNGRSRTLAHASSLPSRRSLALGVIVDARCQRAVDFSLRYGFALLEPGQLGSQDADLMRPDPHLRRRPHAQSAWTTAAGAGTPAQRDLRMCSPSRPPSIQLRSRDWIRRRRSYWQMGTPEIAPGEQRSPEQQL
jgi:hypothetical protein